MYRKITSVMYGSYQAGNSEDGFCIERDTAILNQPIFPDKKDKVISIIEDIRSNGGHLLMINLQSGRSKLVKNWDEINYSDSVGSYDSNNNWTNK